LRWFPARCIIKWAVSEDGLDCLDCLAALAGDLVWHVLREKSLSECANESVGCNHDAVY